MPGYDREVDTAVGRIRATVPEDLVEKFRAASGISREDFRPCTSAECGEICAVDGSNVILLESGSMALVLFRAAQSTFRDLERSRRSLSPEKFAIIGPGVENLDFPVLYEECFGQAPGTPLGNEDRTKAAGILRDTLEYWVAEQMAQCLDPGALLLRDGPSESLPCEPRPGPCEDRRGMQREGHRPRRGEQAHHGHLGRRPPPPPLGQRARKSTRDRCPLVGEDRPGRPRPCPVPPVAARADVYRLLFTPGQRPR